MHSFTVIATDASFDQVVIEGSRHKPVLVDFWAPWCGPCRTLTPTLERLAEEYQGKFVLAKINVDENPMLSQRFAVRSIPTVMGFLDGQAVDQFFGAQPESAVRAFIERLLPSPTDLLRRDAAQQRAEGNLGAALDLLNQAVALAPNDEEARADLVETLLDSGEVAQAREAGSRFGPAKALSDRAARALARLALLDGGSEEADAQTLEARVAAQPDDLAARLALAKLYARDDRHEPALEQLLEMLQRDRSFGDDVARKTMLALFELLGTDHPLVRTYRKALAAALY